MLHLDAPYAGTYPLTQGYANTTFAGEPPGYLYPDGSLSYYTPGPGAVRYDHLHSGEDRALPLGTPITAPADCTVSFAGLDQTGYGNCLKLNHGEVTTLYGHLARFAVSVGQQVSRGQIVAYSGSTGNSTGPHLHWSVIRNSDGHYVDPAPYLAAPAPTAAPPTKPAAKPTLEPTAKPTAKPADPFIPASFTVTVQQAPGVTHLYVGPSTRSEILSDLVPGAVLQCTGWILGESRHDITTDKQDRRWYAVQHGGFIASARCIGNAPGSSA